MDMSEEEKKKYDAFKYWSEMNTEKGVTYIPDYMCENVINIIENQQQELQLKDKVIDEMAEMLVKVPDNADNPTTAVAIAMINRNLEIEKRRVIQYIINKVKGE